METYQFDPAHKDDQDKWIKIEEKFGPQDIPVPDGYYQVMCRNWLLAHPLIRDTEQDMYHKLFMDIQYVKDGKVNSLSPVAA